MLPPLVQICPRWQVTDITVYNPLAAVTLDNGAGLPTRYCLVLHETEEGYESARSTA